MNSDDVIIADIQRIARELNTNKLSLDEYINNGGKIAKDILSDDEQGGFANFCELAGVKAK